MVLHLWLLSAVILLILYRGATLPRPPRGVPVDVRDKHGNTILIIACQNGNKRILKAALRRGADVNAANASGNTALHFCYAFGESKGLPS